VRRSAERLLLALVRDIHTHRVNEENWAKVTAEKEEGAKVFKGKEIREDHKGNRTDTYKHKAEKKEAMKLFSLALFRSRIYVYVCVCVCVCVCVYATSGSNASGARGWY
jgi:ribosome biogenesis GTPase A